jgi:parallel beta-helix repeat protein
LYDADNITFSDCQFTNTLSNGIYSQYSSNLIFNNCNINNNYGKGIELLNDSEYPDFIDCNISNTDGIGVYLNGSNNPEFTRCNIEQCDTAMYLENSPTCKLDSTLIQNNENGIWTNQYLEMYNSSITNTSFPGFPIWADLMYAFPLLENSTIEDNNTPIHIGGSPLYYNRFWPYFEQGYHIMANAQIYSTSYNNSTHARLTIEPGNTIYLAKGVQLQVGYYYSNYNRYYGGELFAEGTSENPITFTSLNDSIGGWNGIYFENASDYSNATSSLKHCTIENGLDYNLYCEHTSQPSIDRSIIRNSQNYGIKCYSSTPTISSSFIVNNLSHGIHLETNSQPTIGNSECATNDIYGNGGYDLYNNTNKTINARYNYWNSIDPAFVGARIYDKGENSALGTVYFEPMSAVSLTSIPELIAQGNNVTHASCFGFSNGAIDINPMGGIPPYTFAWSNGEETEDISNLAAGTYTITLTDDRACSTSSTFEITEPTEIILELSGTDVSCPNCTDGTVSVIASGGTETGSYEYLWDDPAAQTSATATGLGVGTYTVLVTDDNGCTESASYTIIDITGHEVTGNIHYDNTVATNLSNTFVFLENSVSGAYFSSLTDIYGGFSFPGVPDGDYLLNAAPEVWGGVNATDALLILKYPIHPLSGLKLEAGDVNGNGNVNASDATLVLQRSVHLINTFTAGEWYFETTEVTISGDDVNIDFNGICYGDVNGSYNPPYTSDAGTVKLSYRKENSIPTDTEGELNIPLRINKNIDVGAITLSLEYLENVLSPKEIYFADGSQNVWYSSQNNKLHIAWCNLNPVTFSKGEVVFNLKFEILNPFVSQNSLNIKLGESCEFADADGNVIEDVVLYMPQKYSETNPNDNSYEGEDILSGHASVYNSGASSDVLGNNVPNPFSDITNINYTLPFDGKVKLVIYDVYGQEVKILVNEHQQKGQYQVNFNAQNIKSGIYLYRIWIDSKHYGTRKMVVNK